MLAKFNNHANTSNPSNPNSMDDSYDGLLKDFKHLKYTLDSKVIKKIYIKNESKNDNAIQIKKHTGLTMIIESEQPISCKIENSTLYIKVLKKTNNFFDFLCCCTNPFASVKSVTDVADVADIANASTDVVENYNNMWKINSVFIIKYINYSGSGSFVISEGYDKSLTCVKSGISGFVLIKKLNVIDCKYKLLGGGSIKTIESNCCNFDCEINGNGKIKTPKISSNFNCTIKGKCVLNAIVSAQCKITKNVANQSICSVIQL